MAKRKSSKIFIKDGDSVKVLMWAIVGNDGSVMMGFRGSLKKQLH